MPDRKGHKPTDYETSIDRTACYCFKQLKNLTRLERQVKFAEIVGGMDEDFQQAVRVATAEKLKNKGYLK